MRNTLGIPEPDAHVVLFRTGLLRHLDRYMHKLCILPPIAPKTPAEMDAEDAAAEEERLRQLELRKREEEERKQRAAEEQKRAAEEQKRAAEEALRRAELGAAQRQHMSNGGGGGYASTLPGAGGGFVNLAGGGGQHGVVNMHPSMLNPALLQSHNPAMALQYTTPGMVSGQLTSSVGMVPGQLASLGGMDPTAIALQNQMVADFLAASQSSPTAPPSHTPSLNGGMAYEDSDAATLGGGADGGGKRKRGRPRDKKGEPSNPEAERLAAEAAAAKAAAEAAKKKEERDAQYAIDKAAYEKDMALYEKLQSDPAHKEMEAQWMGLKEYVEKLNPVQRFTVTSIAYRSRLGLHGTLEEGNMAAVPVCWLLLCPAEGEGLPEGEVPHDKLAVPLCLFDQLPDYLTPVCLCVLLLCLWRGGGLCCR